MAAHRIGVLILFFSSLSVAAELKLETVLASANTHFPSVMEAIQKRESAKYDRLEALGSFDARIEVYGDARTQGFYDGRYADVKLVKPIQALNAKVYGGHRISGGDYPSYEGKFNTLDKGENRLGVEFSLLRDRAIDAKRLKLKNKELEVDKKNYELLETRYRVQRDAFIAYWSWVAKGRVFKINDNLLSLAVDRTGAIQAKVSSGALAEVYAVENKQYLAQRKTDVIQSKQELEQAAIKLSLYYRNEKGEPIVPDLSSLPSSLVEEGRISKEKLEGDVRKTLLHSPVLQSYIPEISKQENNQEIGGNMLAPRLDLKFEISKDHGEGSQTLEPEEQRVMLNIEIPLERNLGKGISNLAHSNAMALRYKRQLQAEKLKNEIQILGSRINALTDAAENIEREVSLAKKLEKAEVQKFQSGGSDFFLVNIREQNTAKARAKLVKTLFEKKVAYALYREITLGFGP